MALYMYQAGYTAESMAVAAGGAVSSGRTTRLLTGPEWVESLRKAQGSTYRPAR
jgi:hypothetical protein